MLWLFGQQESIFLLKGCLRFTMTIIIVVIIFLRKINSLLRFNVFNEVFALSASKRDKMPFSPIAFSVISYQSKFLPTVLSM